MEGGQGAQSGGATSPTSSIRPGTGNSYKRKRSGAAEFESSPGSGGEENDEDGNSKRQPGVKRACNECRQQKVSHELLEKLMRLDITETTTFNNIAKELIANN